MRYDTVKLPYGDSIYLNGKLFLSTGISEHLYHTELTFYPDSGFGLPDVADPNTGELREVTNNPYHAKIGEIFEFGNGRSFMITRRNKNKELRISFKIPAHYQVTHR